MKTDQGKITKENAKNLLPPLNTGDEPIKRKLDGIIGASIRRERVERKISREEIAAILGLTTSHLGLIERGERGATNVVLDKLRHIFKVPIDHFFTENPDEILVLKTKSGATPFRRRLDMLIDSLTESELDMLSYTIKGLLAMRSNAKAKAKPKYSKKSDINKEEMQ